MHTISCEPEPIHNTCMLSESCKTEGEVWHMVLMDDGLCPPLLLFLFLWSDLVDLGTQC